MRRHYQNDKDKINRTLENVKQLTSQLEKKYLRWTELEEKAEQLKKK